MPVFEKKTRNRYSVVLGLRKPILGQKIFILKNPKMPKTVEGGPFEILYDPFCLKISKN